MSRWTAPLLLLLLPAAALTAHAAEPDEGVAVRRFAFIAGANDGGPDRARLRYATQDARSFSAVLDELGGLDPDDRVLLDEPDRAALLAGLDQLRVMLASAPEATTRREVVVYYSGHADERGLLLGAEQVTYRELRSAIDALPADVRITIVDSCASGTLTRGKGGQKRAPFLIDRSTDVRGYAILTSASADEEAQESDRVRGSFFTHYLVSGLRGAADTTGDERVSLNEAYQYAFHETLARTEGTTRGAQHPNYDIQLAGSGDLVLTDLRETSAGLELPDEVGGRMYVRDEEGRLVVELRKPEGRSMVLALAPGGYQVTLERDGRLLRGAVDLRDGERTRLTLSALAAVEGEPTAARGGVSAQAEGSDVPINLALVPTLDINSAYDPPVRNQLSVGVLAARANYVDGLSVSYLANVGTGELNGAELSGVFNYREGPQAGAALTGIAQINQGDVRGFNAAGITNGTSGNFVGFMASGIAGVVHGNARGLQLSGISNVTTGDLTGAQISLVNVAGRVKGLQLGLVNVAEEVEGAPIGLVSWVDNGLHHAMVWTADHAPVNVGFKLGSRHVYSVLAFGARPGQTRRQFGGLGLGGHVDFEPLFAELDAIGYTVFGDGFDPTAGSLGKVRLMLGWRFYDRLAVFGGPSLNLFFSDDAEGSKTGEDLALGPQKTWQLGQQTVRMSGGALVGLQY